MKLNKHLLAYHQNKQKGYLNDENNQASMLRYDLGESNLPLPEEIKTMIRSFALDELLNSYPELDKQVVLKIAMKHQVIADQIVLGAGLNELIERIARVFLDETKETIIVHPTFFRFEDASKRQHATIINIFTNEKDQFQWTEKTIKNILKHKNANLLWIANPNNPTGKLLQKSWIELLAKSLPNTLLIIDEAYGEYIPQWKKYSAITIAKKYPNILVLRTLSKYFGLAGIRFGYGIGHPKIIKALQSIQLEFLLPSLTLKIAETFFQLSPTDSFAQKIQQERKRIEKALQKLSSIVFIPSHTSTILLRHKEKKNLYEALKAKKILTASMNTCTGIEGKQYIRVTLQANSNHNDYFLRVLKTVI